MTTTPATRRKRKRRELPKTMPLPGAVGVGGLWAMERHVLKGLRGAAERVTSLELLPADDDRELYQRVGSTAIINIAGVIVTGPSLFGRLFGGETSLGFIKRAVQEALADESVSRILMVFDSPGGTGLGLQDVADVIFNADTVKPVFAQTSGTMASAAYFLASQARRIFVAPDSLTGSVGILYVLDDVSKMFEMKGIKTHIFASGRFKGIGVDGTSLTQEHRGELQRMVDDTAAVFLKAVQRGRRLDALQVAEFADGRVHSGAPAVAVGLADEVATLDQTFAKIAGGNADAPALQATAPTPTVLATSQPIDSDPTGDAAVLTPEEIELIVAKDLRRILAIAAAVVGFEDIHGVLDIHHSARVEHWTLGKTHSVLLQRIGDHYWMKNMMKELTYGKA